MALQFIFGGSGYGKTTELIRRTLALAEQKPDRTLFVIVPEQYTIEMQRALVQASSHAGILNVDVVSFARLAHRIFEEQGKLSRVILDDVGKSLLLQRVVQNVEDELTVLKKGIRRPGYITEVKSILSEFMQYGIDEEDLAYLQEQTQRQSAGLSMKLRDLRILFHAFRQGLGERYLTKEEMLLVLADCIADSDLLRDSVIALDGFTGFTPVQMSVIRELMKVCGHMFVSVTIDPSVDPYAYRDPYELFGMSRRMVRILRNTAREESFPEADPCMLKVRKVNSGEVLSFFETNLFRDNACVYEGEDPSAQIELFAATDPRAEVMLAAKKAAQLMRDHDWHYRDIAVVASDMDAYVEDFREIFVRYKLPFFIDHRHSVMDNAFVRYVRGLIDIELTDYAQASVMGFLRTGFGDMSTQEIDSLDNELTARGLRGYRQWRKQTGDEQADALRARVLERLDGFHRAVSGNTLTVTGYSEALYRFLEQDDAIGSLENAADYFAGQGDGPSVKEYEKIYESLMHLFDQFTELIGDQEMTLGEYAQLLDAGLNEIRIGVIPRTRDHILIGDMTRTRIPQAKALIIVGAGASFLPGNLAQAGLLSRWDREVFLDEDLELSPGAKEKTWSQRFYLYQHLTKPTEYLCVTWACSDREGKADEPSYLIRELIEKYPSMNVMTSDSFLEEASGLSPEYGIDYLSAHLQQMMHPGRGDQNRRQQALWQALADWFDRSGACSREIELMRRAGAHRRCAAHLTGKVLAELYPPDRKRSISQLQTYAQCPYKHFLTYGIKLQERDVFEFKMSDFGSVFHAALELYGKRVTREQMNWPDVPDQTREQWIDEAVEEAVQDGGYDQLSASAREAYGMERVKRLVTRSIDVLTRQIAAGTFTPYAYEMDFGTGIIDRLDTLAKEDKLYLKVLDYKTGQQSFDLLREYYGLQIQLPIYMSEAMRLMEQETELTPVPAAMFYYRADDPFIEASAGKNADDEIVKKLKVNGVLQDDPAVLQGLDSELPSNSVVAPFGLTKDGHLRKDASAVSEREMDTIVRYARHLADQQNQRIADGKIEVSPYKLDQETGCKYCEYRNICHFEPRQERYRELNKMERDEVLDKMRQEIGE